MKKEDCYSRVTWSLRGSAVIYRYRHRRRKFEFEFEQEQIKPQWFEGADTRPNVE